MGITVAVEPLRSAAAGNVTPMEWGRGREPARIRRDRAPDDRRGLSPQGFLGGARAHLEERAEPVRSAAARKIAVDRVRAEPAAGGAAGGGADRRREDEEEEEGE